MKVTVVGTGYVGLVSGACLAEMGNDVLCLDVDADKIAILEGGGIPIHEPGLDQIVARNVAAGRLHFTTDVRARRGARPAAVHRRRHAARRRRLGRPASTCSRPRATSACYMNEYKVVVDKSTVPVGTADKVRAAIAAALAERGAAIDFSVVSNPEFLKEGAAVDDFMRPDRIIVGVDDERATRVMRDLYAPFQRNHDKLVVMDLRSAELTKYAANAMLATRISFMNELALLAERVGADIEQVRLGIGSDPRIGFGFLYSGCGYGGSCFPKDVKALIHTADEAGRGLQVLRAVESANEAQKRVLIEKIVRRFGNDLAGRRFALWGLAFKPNTDDMREAPSRVVIGELLARGASVQAYDPIAMPEAQRVLGESPGLAFADSAMGALQAADALVIVTEWKEFRSPDFERIKATLLQPVMFDGRNMFAPATVEAAGIEYHAIGRLGSRHLAALCWAA